MDLITSLFDTSDFPARWTCGRWTAAHGWLHILSDLGVWSAYVAIPLVLGYFLLRRRDLPFRSIMLLFGAFILACGTTHLMEAIIFWWPAYRLAGMIKLFTAVVSWATVFALVPIVPRVLAMRSPEELEREIGARKLAEDALQRANAELEERVARRTNELTQAMAALHAERELLRITLASIGDAVIVTDAQGQVTFLNALSETLTGWNAAEAQGVPLERVFPILNEQSRQPAANPALQALAEGVTVGLANHTVLVHRDGSERPIDDSAAPIRDAQDQVVGCVLVFRDVTKRRQAEIELRDADRRKDEFLALLAHELRNPLAPIRNGLHWMRLAGPAGAEVTEVRAMMERQLEHLIRLVDDLLDVSRISRGKIELRRERIDLSAAIDAALEMCQESLQKHDHQLEVQLPPETVWLDVDKTRLAQALSNLVNNAVKYTPKGGEIRLSVQKQATEVLISVKDNGIGIPPEMLSHVFDMFTQVDRSLERSQGGLGIGLNIVKRLIELHGGTIEARSAGENQGSEFVIRLPLAAEPKPVASSKPEPTNGGKTVTRHRVLVADDNHDSAASLEMMLRLLGQETRQAHDGLEAVKVAEEFLPELILLDIGMPKLNGYDACRRIREQSWGRHIVIVALTGWGQEEDVRRSREAGFTFHIVKPIELSALQKLLAGLSGERG